MIDPKLREERPQITNALLRQFAVLCVLVFGGLSVLDGYARHRSGRAAVELVGVAVGIMGLVKPPAIRPVFEAAIALTAPIGWAVSHLMLAVIFYLLFTPLACVLRFSGRDALARRFDKNAVTHWRTRQQSSDPESYLH